MANQFSGSFSEQIGGFAEAALDAIRQTIQDVLIIVGETVINLTPVDTGRAKANWQFSIGAPLKGSLDRFDKTGDDTIAELISRVNAMEPGQVAYLVNNLIYAPVLEYGLYPPPQKEPTKVTPAGYSKKAPAGMVRITLAQFQKFVAEAAARNRV